MKCLACTPTYNIISYHASLEGDIIFVSTRDVYAIDIIRGGAEDDINSIHITSTNKNNITRVKEA